MGNGKKQRAKELPKVRILLLPLIMAVIILSAVFCSEMPVWACVMLGISNGALVYFLFVVLKVQRNIMDKVCSDKTQEILSEQETAACAQRIAEEGIVLLKNEENLLPLPQGAHLNLVGLRCVQMNYNGGGSAASDESKCMTLEQALEAAGFLLNRDLLNLSYNYLKNGRASITSPGKKFRVKSGSRQKGGAEFIAKPGSPVKTELPVSLLTSRLLYEDGKTVLEHAGQFGDTALVVLARGGGEGYDLDPDDLRLIESERLLLDEVSRHFQKIILVLNMANTMEMGWLAEYPSIKGVLWTGFPGTSGNAALADILRGRVNPSGRLPDTWAASNLSAPAANNFCQMQENGTWCRESFHYSNAPEKKGYFVHYSEGIYTGYRYFETRAALDKTFDYAAEVVWPFGYGLGYTEFQQQIVEFYVSGEQLHLRVLVKNTGSCAGKEVIQVYSTPPYTGRIEKSIVSLVAFVKTELLAEGASEELTIDIPKKELASFDEQSGKWTLERGDYVLSLRRDSHTVTDEAAWKLEDEIVYPGTVSLFADARTDSLTRTFDQNHRAFTGPKEADFIAGTRVLEALQFHVPTDEELGLSPEDMPLTGKRNGIRLREMKGVQKDDTKWDMFVQQLTVPELCHLCGNGAWQTAAIRRLGVPRTVIPDGSTSMAATIFSALVMGKGKAGITWPCPSVLAATFNCWLALQEGDGVGKSANVMGYAGWYAPSMNCHRTAFNSRNFEYYSEDGLLAGKIAANVVKGVQSHHVNVFIKHFALNERETNARSQLFTWCGEQAMREIYFKPFELSVKEGGALGVMSSFNHIGHTWAGGSPALLTDLLVKEWGFQGCVVTDACLYPHMDVMQMVYAGGDLVLDTLGGFTGGNIKRRSLLLAVQNPKHKIAAARWLQASAKDILYAVCQTLQ